MKFYGEGNEDLKGLELPVFYNTKKSGSRIRRNAFEGFKVDLTQREKSLLFAFTDMF